jgi:hypothetical protein
MVSNDDLLNLSNEDLAKEIAEHQKRLGLLFQIMGSRILKKTEGEGFMKDENINVAEYWLDVALNHPDIIAADKSMVDFAAKVIFFNTIVSVATQDAQIGILLKTPRDVVSKDCAAYVSYIRSQVQDRKSNPVFKLILDKEPSPRKSPTKKSPPTDPPTTP